MERPSRSAAASSRVHDCASRTRRPFRTAASAGSPPHPISLAMLPPFCGIVPLLQRRGLRGDSRRRDNRDGGKRSRAHPCGCALRFRLLQRPRQGGGVECGECSIDFGGEVLACVEVSRCEDAPRVLVFGRSVLARSDRDGTAILRACLLGVERDVGDSPDRITDLDDDLRAAGQAGGILECREECGGAEGGIGSAVADALNRCHLLRGRVATVERREERRDILKTLRVALRCCVRDFAAHLRDDFLLVHLHCPFVLTLALWRPSPRF
jgi:hypothetical protein